MYQLLFVIHGMGSGERPANDPDWWTGLLENLRKDARTYAHDGDLVMKSPKSGQILVVPLTYHQFFDAIRAQWSQQGPDSGWLPLLKQLVFSDPQVLAKLPEWVQSAEEFFWTHILDVLLYRYVNEFRTPIRDSVATQIAEAWHKADMDNGANTPVHFVAHSLGTSVLHDSICLLASDPGFSPGTHLISSVVTCANVSSALETNYPAYKSVDRVVNAAPPPDGMTAAHFSVRHELDPITAVKTFRGDLHGWPADCYHDSVTIEVKDWNVHGYSHYMANPVVHIKLFERLWQTEPWASRLPGAMTAYRNSPGTACPVAISQARQGLKEILAHPWPSTPIGLLDAGSRTIKVLRDAKKACEAEKP